MNFLCCWETTQCGVLKWLISKIMPFMIQFRQLHVLKSLTGTNICIKWVPFSISSPKLNSSYTPQRPCSFIHRFPLSLNTTVWGKIWSGRSGQTDRKKKGVRANDSDAFQFWCHSRSCNCMQPIWAVHDQLQSHSVGGQPSYTEYYKWPICSKRIPHPQTLNIRHQRGHTDLIVFSWRYLAQRQSQVGKDGLRSPHGPLDSVKRPEPSGNGPTLRSKSAALTIAKQDPKARQFGHLWPSNFSLINFKWVSMDSKWNRKWSWFSTLNLGSGKMVARTNGGCVRNMGR